MPWRKNGAHIIASEPAAFGKMDGHYVREILPGEIVVIDRDGIQSTIFGHSEHHALCIFELIYFSGVAGRVFGFKQSIQTFRRRLGRQLAIEQLIATDVVCPVPDSGNSGALGYALQSGRPFDFGLIRSHYVDRTFIEPKQNIKGLKNRLKFDADPDVVSGKRVVVVDDSIVRSNTAREIITMLREYGAKEVHLRIHSPPIISPCYFGIDTPKFDDLIAASKSVQEIRETIGATSLGYLSADGLLACVKDTNEQFCDGCFTGNYPIKITDR